MATVIEWTDALSVGVKAIDDQHKKLVAILNKLTAGLAKGEGASVMQPVLGELVSYTVTHFNQEEALQRMHGYPGLAAHQKIHANLVGEVQKFQERLRKGEISLSVEVFGFLQDWLSKHIKGEDKALGTYLNSKGIK